MVGDLVGVQLAHAGFQTIGGNEAKGRGNAARSNRLIELALHYHHSSSRVASTSPLERVNHGGQDNTF